MVSKEDFDGILADQRMPYETGGTGTDALEKIKMTLVILLKSYFQGKKSKLTFGDFINFHRSERARKTDTDMKSRQMSITEFVRM